MKLKKVELHRFEAFGDEFARLIHEHADQLVRVGDDLANLSRAFERHRARTRRIKVDPDHIGAAVHRSDGVLDAGYAADFHPDAHRAETPSRARTNSGNFAAGLPSRRRLSPIRNARAPAASRRRMSSGVLIPLSP